MPNFADVLAKIAKIKKVVIELYERTVVAEPVVETVNSTIEVPNILADPTAIQVKETREEGKIKKRKAKANEKKVRLESIRGEANQEMRVRRWP